MSMKRFVVAGHSMLPTLAPGQEVVATQSLKPSVGDLVAFPDPEIDDRWLIKRLQDAAGHVASDNPEDSARDSKEFGSVPVGTMHTVINRLDRATFEEAATLLASEDESIQRVIERWGMPEFWARIPGFETLVLLILEQQVSLESGAAMYKRLRDLLGSVEPQRILDCGEQPVRDIGVTRQKASYLAGLAEAVESGGLSLTAIEHMGVDEAREALTSLKGIGNWTADAYLLSASRRPDMWPVGDRALQVGAGEVVGMERPADEEELTLLGEPWRPVRAVAARVIWHNYLCERGRVEPPDPTL